MKQQKNFAVASLFPEKYISVFNDDNGEVLGRIWKEGKKYISHALKTGQKAKVKNLDAARNFIMYPKMNLFFVGEIMTQDEAKVIRYDLYKINQSGQRVKVDELFKKGEAEAEKAYRERREDGYIFQIINIYEDKNQQKLL